MLFSFFFFFVAVVAAATDANINFGFVQLLIFIQLIHTDVSDFVVVVAADSSVVVITRVYFF